MKITSFNPIIVTKDRASAVELFEQLGFEQRHTPLSPIPVRQTPIWSMPTDTVLISRRMIGYPVI